MVTFLHRNLQLWELCLRLGPLTPSYGGLGSLTHYSRCFAVHPTGETPDRVHPKTKIKSRCLWANMIFWWQCVWSVDYMSSVCGVVLTCVMTTCVVCCTAIWKVIRSWLTAEQKTKTILVTKQDMSKYVAADQLEEHMVAAWPCHGTVAAWLMSWHGRSLTHVMALSSCGDTVVMWWHTCWLDKIDQT